MSATLRSLVAQSSLAALAPLEAVLDPAYPDAWREIATCLYLQLREREELAGLGDARVAQLALLLTEGLRAEIGGSQPYLSKGVGFELSQRDRQILAEFNGRNHDELARKWDLTPRQIYAILAVRVREEFERRQGRLALEDGA